MCDNAYMLSDNWGVYYSGSRNNQKKITLIKNKVMTQEQKAKRYDESLGNARQEYNTIENIERKQWLEDIFPELKESEDESIRKEFCEDIWTFIPNEKAHKYIAWLEKQGEQKLQIEKLPFETKTIEERLGINKKGCINGENGDMKETEHKIEPKFKIGDWVISNNKQSTYQVVEVKRGIYVLRDNADNHEYHIGIEECEKSGRLWNISDAKDGDVLATKCGAFIAKEYLDIINPDGVIAYCGINSMGRFDKCDGIYPWTDEKIAPATKEQRDLLFAKMHESEYMWDAEKKELMKIEQKKDMNNKLTDVNHEYFSKLLENDDSENINDYAYQVAYCMSHDWIEETATWDDVQKACKLGVEWQKRRYEKEWSEEDEDNFNCCIGALKSYFGEQSDEFINWLKTLKQIIGG